MTNNFCLWKSERRALPCAVEVNGRAFSISTSYKTILKIFALMNDEEILPQHKSALLIKYFFVDEPPECGWDEAFGWFVRCGEEPQDDNGDAPKFDYEFDAPEIFSSFMMLYGIDIFQTDMHWWKFRALLDGCFRCECPLSEKLRIRTIDVAKCDNKFEAQRAKDAVQIPARQSENDKIVERAIEERLLRGESIADLIKR